VRRALARESLVIVRAGWFTPADVGIVLALRRQYRLVVRVRRADAGRLLRCCVRRHVAIIAVTADEPTADQRAAPAARHRRRIGPVSQGVLDQFWLWRMQSGLKNAYESIKAFSETDFTEDLKKIDVPTLVLHGEDDQVVPVKGAAVKSAWLVKDAKLETHAAASV
jgi:pimeloyl-ACP methyl ester carboxylesterase